MRKIVTACLFLALTVSPTAWAQTGTITGTVTEAESGETLPTVNVAVEGTQLGTSTGADGEYTIENVPAGTQTVSASFVGYETASVEVTVEAGETLTQDFELETGAVGLEEVVVTGYGAEREVEVTGAVSSVSSEQIENVPLQNTQALLQGRASGVTVNATSGNPGSGFEVNVRGEGSIGGGDDPLYVVDGVKMSFAQGSEITDRSPLNAISPGDIESIEVLKDAAAASIYGAQAANGVVLITTKSGSEGGAPQVTLSYEGGTRFQSNRFDLMSRDEWVQFQVDAFGEEDFRNSILPDYGYDPSTPFDQLKDFDWQDWLFQPGSHQKASFTAQGGDEDTQYFLSGSWQNTGGAMQAEAVKYKRLGARVNLSQQFTDKLGTDINIGLSNEDDEGVCQDGFFINCPFYQSIGEEPPISFPYLDDVPEGFRAEQAPGEYNPFTEQSSVYNPALVLNEEVRESSIFQLVGSVSPSYDIAEWLTAEGTFGIDYQYFQDSDYESPASSPGAGGELYRNNSVVTNMQGNVRLRAQETFGDVHSLSGFVGTEYQRQYNIENEVGVSGFNNDLIRVISGGTQADFYQGFNSEYRVLSYLGRAKYSYDDRYILNLTGRYDGHSRFGANNRFGFFPSISAAWRISEEPFFNADFVDNLKVRASYGVVGNSSIGNYAARGLYNLSGSYKGQPGFRPSQLANPNLTWEESRSVNLATDWSLWNGRFTGSINAYRKITTDLLLGRQLPVSSGYGSITENIGELLNRGFDLELETINVETDDFFWSTRFNASVNQNEVLELQEGAESLNPSGVLPTAVGHSLEAWKVPVWAGVNPADGTPLYRDADGNLTYQPGPEDEQFVDGGEHDVVGGFGTEVGYKGLSLRVLFNYSYGGNNLPNTQRTWTSAFGEGVLADLKDRWREEGDIASYPRSTPFGDFSNADDPGGITTRWLYNSSYIRLRNATLSYDLPGALTSPVGLSSARVYASGINLLTWTTYLGIDPEVADALESSSYPTEQQINFGVEVSL